MGSIAAGRWLFCTSRLACSYGGLGADLGIEVGFEGIEPRGDGFRGREFGGDRVGGFQTVAGDGENGGLVRVDAAFADELLGYAGGHAAGGLGEDAFGFGEEFDGVNDFRVRDIFGPATAFEDLLGGVVAVGRI